MAGFGYFPPAGGGGGASSHPVLTGRSTADSHPISAITGLQAALDAAGGGLFLSILYHYNVDIGALTGLPPVAGLKIGFNAQTTGSQNGYYLTDGAGGVDTGSKVVIRQASNLGLPVLAAVNLYDSNTPPDMNGAEDLWAYLNLNGSADLPDSQGLEAFAVTTLDGVNYLLTPHTVPPAALITQVLRLTSMNDHLVTGPTTFTLGIQSCIISADTTAGDVTCVMGIHGGVPRLTMFENNGTGDLFIENDASESAFATTIPPGGRALVMPNQGAWDRWDMIPKWNPSDLIYDKDKFIRFTEDGDLIRDHVVHQYLVTDVSVPGGGWVIEDRDVNYIRWVTVATPTAITLPDDARHVVWFECPASTGIDANTAGGVVYRTGVGTPLFEIAPDEVWVAKCYFGNHWVAHKLGMVGVDGVVRDVPGGGGGITEHVKPTACISPARGLFVVGDVATAVFDSMALEDFYCYSFYLGEPVTIEGWSWYGSGDSTGPYLTMRVGLYADEDGVPVGAPIFDSPLEGPYFNPGGTFTPLVLDPGRYHICYGLQDFDEATQVPSDTTGYGYRVGISPVSNVRNVGTTALLAFTAAGALPTDPSVSEVQVSGVVFPDIDLMVVT